MRNTPRDGGAYGDVDHEVGQDRTFVCEGVDVGRFDECAVVCAQCPAALFVGVNDEEIWGVCHVFAPFSEAVCNWFRPVHQCRGGAPVPARWVVGRGFVYSSIRVTRGHRFLPTSCSFLSQVLLRGRDVRQRCFEVDRGLRCCRGGLFLRPETFA